MSHLLLKLTKLGNNYDLLGHFDTQITSTMYRCANTQTQTMAVAYTRLAWQKEPMYQMM